MDKDQGLTFDEFGIMLSRIALHGQHNLRIIRGDVEGKRVRTRTL